MNLWPHQSRGIDAVVAAIARGVRRVCLTSPTGGGKTAMVQGLARYYLARNLGVVIYTNRKLLVEQLTKVLAEGGFTFGVRAAGHEDNRDRLLQVSSLQTENARGLSANIGGWDLHDASLAVVDEAHCNTGSVAREVIQRHFDRGGAVVGVTATPIDLGGIYDELVVAGTNSELRKCGALIPALHYGPDEPDLKRIGKVALGSDLTEKQAVKAMMTPTIFGRVYDSWQRLNPFARPAILFAPGVSESIWFAQEFWKKGVSAAHIDGENVWVDGKFYPTSPQARADILKGSEGGRIHVTCNRFVLREGVDAPWLSHGIFATVFGSLQSYLQAGGRLLRSHPSCRSVTIQDHGGNWWRHGSLNADRTWDLDATSGGLAGMREDRLRAKVEREPYCCPECKQILAQRVCPCGFEVPLGRQSRSVVQVDGSLKELRGDIFKPRKISTAPDGPTKWKAMYHRSARAKGGRTFRAAFALFAAENDWQWPDPTWPLMPVEPVDHYRLVSEVGRERLR